MPKLDVEDNPPKTINEYDLNEEFKTYVTYESKPQFGITGIVRKALRVIDWRWNAKAVKPAGSAQWALHGDYFPTTELLLNSQAVPYVSNVNVIGEVPYNVRFYSDTPETSLRRWQRKSIASSAINITTKRDVAVWRKANGVWYVVNPDGSLQAATQWGVDYDIPVPADYDGDGRADFAVFRPDNPATVEDECQNGCSWYVLKSSDNNLQVYTFGSKGDSPVPSDYNGDGRTDFAVFRPNTGVWHIMKSTDNSYYAVQFGQSGDVPLPSDYDGDGFNDQAVWSPGAATWRILNSTNQSVTTQLWGAASDTPVIGDYDGDGKTDIANWQSSGNWHILLSANLQTMNVNFGLPTIDKPVAGDYDGDGKTDIAVWRPNGTQTAIWFIIKSSDGQLMQRYWGIEGDVPVPAAYSRQ